MSEKNINKNKELFENMPVSKAVKTMAVPAVISQLISDIITVTVSLFVHKNYLRKLDIQNVL